MGWLTQAIVGLHTRAADPSRNLHERPLLDAIRWTSAAAVAIGHAIGLILARQQGPAHALLPLNYLSDLRSPAVTLFFVISGYLVGGGVLLKGERFKWRPYAIARFTRIYIVLVPAIVLLVALDGTSWLIDPANPVYARVWPSGVIGNEPLYSHYLPINWAATLLSFESVLAPPLGSGGPLWSLGYEWVFYFVFPLLVVPLARFRSLLWPFLAVGALIGVLAIVGRRADAICFTVWVLGALARVLVEYASIPRWVSLAGAAFAAAMVALSPIALSQWVYYAVGLGFALYLSRFDAREKGFSPALDRSLAGFSYSLYVIHLPLLVFIVFLLNRAAIVPATGLGLSWLSAGLILLLLATAGLAAWLFGRAFEDRTDAARARLLALTARR